MNETVKKFLTNGRIITLVIFLILALVAIHPKFWVEGVAIRNVQMNSSAALAGIENPKPTAAPTSREIISSMNGQPIKNVEDYTNFVKLLQPNQTITIQTNKALYSLTTREKMKIIGYENITEEQTKQVPQNVSQQNGSLTNVTTNVTKTENVTTNVTIEVPITIAEGMESLGLTIYQSPTSNLRQGLDLQGGTRVVLQPEVEQSKEDMETILSNMKERLNVYGLSDVIVHEAGDLSGNQYIVVEIAGANEEEVKNLLAKQGKFEAKIGNTTVFRGGKDITYVCRSADCSGIDSRTGCSQSNSQWLCGFQFAISLSPEAAQGQADATRNLAVVPGGGNDPVLSEKIEFYLDDQLVDALNIGAELRGRATTDISIRGSGSGISQPDAVTNTLESMKRLQTILTTGSLPVKMNIVRTDNLSAVLGKQFLQNAILIGIVAQLAVCLVIFLGYRSLKVAIPILITGTSEVVLLLGLAALIGWNLDLAALAGIIISVGTGVDHQIVIADEVRMGTKESKEYWLRKLKRAFFIIMTAYATMFVAMVPLLFAGAGLLKGFALTTIMGFSFGVFISRPAFAAMIKILHKEQ